MRKCQIILPLSGNCRGNCGEMMLRRRRRSCLKTGRSAGVARQPWTRYDALPVWPAASSLPYLAEVANIIESGRAELGANRR